MPQPDSAFHLAYVLGRWSAELRHSAFWCWVDTDSPWRDDGVPVVPPAGPREAYLVLRETSRQIQEHSDGSEQDGATKYVVTLDELWLKFQKVWLCPEHREELRDQDAAEVDETFYERRQSLIEAGPFATIPWAKWEAATQELIGNLSSLHATCFNLGGLIATVQHRASWESPILVDVDLPSTFGELGFDFYDSLSPVIDGLIGELSVCLPALKKYQPFDISRYRWERADLPPTLLHRSWAYRQVDELDRSLDAELFAVRFVPAWDEQRGKLQVGDRELTSYGRHPATNQRLLLATFEARGWPREIANPIEDDISGRERLKEAVKELNRRQDAIRFRTAKAATVARWEWEPDWTPFN